MKAVIQYAKEDGGTAEEYAAMAAMCASGRNTVEILKAEAEISRNGRIDSWYGEDTGCYDVWITFVAIIDHGFGGIIEGGAYLTDICSIADNNREEIRKHMYIRRFVEE